MTLIHDAVAEAVEVAVLMIPVVEDILIERKEMNRDEDNYDVVQ